MQHPSEPSSATSAPGLLQRAQLAALHVLPHHPLSALMRFATRIRFAPWKNWQIRWFIRRYGVDMSEAQEPSPLAYPDFNTFFTRALKPELRPICAGAYTIACPADGAMSELGTVRDGQLMQVKGMRYSLSSLLGDDPALAARFEGGGYACIYLSPRDYHRVHMPLAGRLSEMRHVPGRLFSVNPASVHGVRGLFARNERVVSLFETELGLLAVVLVGAVFVGSIDQVWAGTVTPRIHARGAATTPGLMLAKGEEMGRFNMGSTVILVLANEHVRWEPHLAAEKPVKMGEQLAHVAEPSSKAEGGKG